MYALRFAGLCRVHLVRPGASLGLFGVVLVCPGAPMGSLDSLGFVWFVHVLYGYHLVI